MKSVPRLLTILAALVGFGSTAAASASVLQCVPYARAESGIAIHGNAATWWSQAEGSYDRGQTPQVGAVLVFRSTAAMPYGHVAVIGKIVDERHVLLDHANWSRPGMIETAAMAEDVSEAGDWSDVRVWYDPIKGMGARTNPTFGFIYAPGHESLSQTTLAKADESGELAGD